MPYVHFERKPNESGVIVMDITISYASPYASFLTHLSSYSPYEVKKNKKNFLWTPLFKIEKWVKSQNSIHYKWIKSKNLIHDKWIKSQNLIHDKWGGCFLIW